MFGDDWTWLNPPPAWTLEDGALSAKTGARTDFWRKTHCGIVRDDGHFFHRAATGDFTASVAFTADYRQLYEQAGLMLRLDDARWIKCGIEFSDGVQNVSAVVTDGFSDWSVIPLAAPPTTVRLRLTRRAAACRIDYALDAGPWRLARLAPFPYEETAAIGLMCCSPESAGFQVTFTDFALGPPLAVGLHD